MLKRFILPVYGIKVEGERLKTLIADELENRNKDESELFQLHEDWSTLDGWLIGNQKNPEGLIVGSALYIHSNPSVIGEHMDLLDPEFNMSQMIDLHEQIEDFAVNFGYKEAIIKFLGEGYENAELKLYMVYMEWEKEAE